MTGEHIQERPQGLGSGVLEDLDGEVRDVCGGIAASPQDLGESLGGGLGVATPHRVATQSLQAPGHPVPHTATAIVMLYGLHVSCSVFPKKRHSEPNPLGCEKDIDIDTRVRVRDGLN